MWCGVVGVFVVITPPTMNYSTHTNTNTHLFSAVLIPPPAFASCSRSVLSWFSLLLLLTAHAYTETVLDDARVAVISE